MVPQAAQVARFADFGRVWPSDSGRRPQAGQEEGHFEDWGGQGGGGGGSRGPSGRSQRSVGQSQSGRSTSQGYGSDEYYYNEDQGRGGEAAAEEEEEEMTEEVAAVLDVLAEVAAGWPDPAALYACYGSGGGGAEGGDLEVIFKLKLSLNDWRRGGGGCGVLT